MKKLGVLIIFFVILFLIFSFSVNKKRNYELEYEFKKYKVKEMYDKKIDSYIITVNYKKRNYEFIIENEYSSKRRIIENIKITDKENDCLKIKAFGKDSATLCYNDGFYIYKTKQKKSDILKTYENVNLYKKGKYYVWNNYGITSLSKEKKIKFLDSETYNNPLFYTTDRYLIVADYDQKRTYNKFYIYDSYKDKLDEFKIDYDISFDSYFMGDVDGFIYLYDLKNKVQYKIDIAKQKIDIVSDKNGGKYYNKKWEDVTYNKLKYNELKFIYNNKYNYYIKDNKLYLTYYNSKDEIMISDNNIIDIISVFDDKVYYLVDSSVYMYEYNKGEEIIMENFEWNFSYFGKIFIFN